MLHHSECTHIKKVKDGSQKRKKKASISDTETADTGDSDSSVCATYSIEDHSDKKPSKLKDYYFLSLIVCFTGVISCYSGYAVLQESL